MARHRRQARPDVTWVACERDGAGRDRPLPGQPSEGFTSIISTMDWCHRRGLITYVTGGGEPYYEGWGTRYFAVDRSKLQKEDAG